MTLRDELARVVAERRGANPRNEPGHVDYGIAAAVLPFIEEARVAERERVTRIIREHRDSILSEHAESRQARAPLPVGQCGFVQGLEYVLALLAEEQALTEGGE